MRALTVWASKFIRSWFLWAGVAASLLCFIGSEAHEYGHFKERHCVVLDKLQSSGRYSGTFYLVMKEDRGIVFDLSVQPSTYSQVKVGQTVVFRLRDFDIK